MLKHVSMQNAINKHARVQANVATLLALRVDVLSARSDGSEDAMHHLVCVVKQKDWHPATVRKCCSATPAGQASGIDGAPE